MWRPYLEALQPQFMLAVPSNVGWLSSYLPGNAAMRAIGERTVGAEFVSPVMAALSVLSFGPSAAATGHKDRGAPVLAALLCATSVQVLANAMAPFAMTAHLFFNLAWLWGYQRKNAIEDSCESPQASLRPACTRLSSTHCSSRPSSSTCG